MFFKSSMAMSRRELQHQIGSRYEARLDAGLRSLISKSNGEMRLTDTGWTKQHDVLRSLDKRQR